MKTRIFTINSEKVIDNLTAFLKSQDLEPTLEVIVQLKKKDRSVLQNSMYWYWITIIADELGETKQDIHERFKYNILCRIFERDEPGYGEMLQSVRKVRKLGMHKEHKALVKNIIRLTSTTSATVKQFTEYLKEIEKDMVGKGIILPRPEDRYYSAMGIKQGKL